MNKKGRYGIINHMHEGNINVITIKLWKKRNRVYYRMLKNNIAILIYSFLNFISMYYILYKNSAIFFLNNRLYIK